MKGMRKGNEKLAILMYILLNIGIILRILFEPFYLIDRLFIKFFNFLFQQYYNFFQFYYMFIYYGIE
ncbi:MAG: hypothetical protein KatS3mg068_2297 [Candidatus Sericytochromatia bacterium]|nr:MAG: hypothetical protein KatS3mg068_2297 [Candidatus Sericytochromatia bacterium]